MLRKSGEIPSRTASPDHGVPDPVLYGRMTDLGKALFSRPEMHDLIPFAMDRLIETTGAEHGLLILFGPAGETIFEVMRNLNKEDIEDPQFEVSRTLVDRVRSGGEPVCLENALADPRAKTSGSVARLKLLSVICLPLKHGGKTFGVLYLDNRSVEGVFEGETFRWVREFADFVSIAAWNALERKHLADRVNNLETELRGSHRFEAIVGSHPRLVEILKLVSQVADTDTTVLIQGESGTGKELVARAIHFNSGRRDKPFIAINCAALPENLLESELFGHVRGAFTGAVKDKAGWFEQADGGTLFMDEIGDTPLHLQVKLLRVLQTGEYSRVGSTEIRRCDVRLIAAASRDLKTLIAGGRFREELYYRINVIDITLPPLRERKCDIPLLARHFLDRYGARLNKTGLRLSREAESILLSHSFPGNIRELENLVQRAVVLAEGGLIEPRHFPEDLVSGAPGFSYRPGRGRKPSPSSSFRESKRRAMEAFEREYLSECLKTSKGNVSLAARCAGMDVKNFRDKTKKYGIQPASFKVSARSVKQVDDRRSKQD